MFVSSAILVYLHPIAARDSVLSHVGRISVMQLSVDNVVLSLVVIVADEHRSACIPRDCRQSPAARR